MGATQAGSARRTAQITSPASGQRVIRGASPVAAVAIRCPTFGEILRAFSCSSCQIVAESMRFVGAPSARFLKEGSKDPGSALHKAGGFRRLGLFGYSRRPALASVAAKGKQNWTRVKWRNR